MSTCYICTVHGEPSEDSESVICCSTCGIFTCVWDGARLHGKGASECAICMVRVLVESAKRAHPTGDPGGGGGATAAEANVREFLGTEDFERECEQLATISTTYRAGWRGLLRMQQLPHQTAHEFGLRVAALAGGRAGLAQEVTAGLDANTMDPDLLADAAGVGEYARRLTATGPQTLASVAKAVALQADRELTAKVDMESATPAVATSYETQKEPDEEKIEKVNYM